MDGVVCDGASETCGGKLGYHQVDDCSDAPYFQEDDCEDRLYDMAWWDDEGDEPVCSL